MRVGFTTRLGGRGSESAEESFGIRRSLYKLRKECFQRRNLTSAPKADDEKRQLSQRQTAAPPKIKCNAEFFHKLFGDTTSSFEINRLFGG